MPIHGVIFDVDGTLVDSNAAHAHAWHDALAEFGHSVPVAQILPLIGMGGDKLLPEVTKLASDSPEGQQIRQRRAAIFEERYLPHIDGLPKVHELLTALQQRGLKLAVASSAKQDELVPLLKKAHAAAILQRRTSSDDADESKPDPDIVQAALDQLKLPPEQVLMIGDTPYDVQAAHRAGVAFIGVRSGGWQSSDLEGAIAVYADVAELLANLDHSPLAD